MPGFTDALELLILDHIFTDPAWTPPNPLYLGLFRGTLSDDAGGGLTEAVIGVGSYARVAVAPADWGAASGTAPAQKLNSVAKALATATADWGGGANFTHWGILSASTAGTLYIIGVLTTAKPVLTGDTPNFPVGALATKLGDPGDPF